MSLLVLGACHGETSAGSFGGSVPQVTSASTADAAGTSSTSTSGPSSPSGTSADGAADGSTTPLLDVGSDFDLGSVKPLGCGGKIDFLFLISRHAFMNLPPDNAPWLGTVHERLNLAFPKFFQTIQSKFTDFDYHIMVVDGDPLPFWGTPSCSKDCSDPSCATIQDYPCDQFDLVSDCDRTVGAGSVFNAGPNAENEPCDLPQGRRYLVKEDPSPEETFACMAHVGTGGYDFLNEALMATMSDALNGPGGCNDGFIRDDALLMVTFIQNTGDLDSEGDVWDWWKSVREAKHEDQNAVVMFAINQADDLEDCMTQKVEYDRNCELMRKFPYRDQVNIWEDDFGPAFDRATDLLVTACEGFVPIPQ